jgi:plasmid stabilization system protein ParE
MAYLGERASEETALRYYDSVREACQPLVAHPLGGKGFETNIDRLKGLRQFPVTAPFERFLIF